jgi:hypothetical protein
MADSSMAVVSSNPCGGSVARRMRHSQADGIVQSSHSRDYEGIRGRTTHMTDFPGILGKTDLP